MKTVLSIFLICAALAFCGCSGDKDDEQKPDNNFIEIPKGVAQ